jgi:hypothetical protein
MKRMFTSYSLSTFKEIKNVEFTNELRDARKSTDGCLIFLFDNEVKKVDMTTKEASLELLFKFDAVCMD